MPNKAPTPAAQSKQMKALLDGLNTNPPANFTTVSINNTSYTLPALITKLTGYQDAYDTADKTEVARIAALQARETITPNAVALVAGTRSLLKTMLGRFSPSLPDFGVTADKEPTKLTAAQKVAKAAKAKATRIARHTMGPKQKAKIKGV